ncbi:response regulator [Phenylobacterium sp. SCN 70-31]|uniref:response regulator n=1 Tax=Phenylobacterium sp. SCN 70-31 TaxID=1660129 RepID=UPI00086DB02A|nr:response regulator [Phenylobacterium sp. SCN 70-31]ODT86037.1 MAG: DNA-binding response regulator [Phenylobacterium sp. SCN 70-31]
MTADSPAPTARHILVVDDDTDLRGQIVDYLSEHGYQVHAAADARTMDQALESAPIDLVVLDVMLPGEDGLSICRRLAAEGGPAIIMVSAMGEEIDRVLGLELGADDYLAKPCSPRELLARVRAVFRRLDEVRGGAPKRGKAYRFQGFTLDALRRQLRAPNGATILLTSGEYSLLSAFLDHPQRILSRDQLLDIARGEDVDVFDRAVDVQISRLRRKLHACSDGEIIKTVRGAGYMFDVAVTRP